MKKLILAMVTLAIIGAAVPTVMFATQGGGKANLTPPVSVSAKFDIQDNGTTLTVTGTAKGLTPAIGPFPPEHYESLFYGVGSTVNGIAACFPNSPNTLTGDQMFIGVWTVLPDGTGTLGPVVQSGAAYTPLSTLGTISVRHAHGLGIGPGLVVACGKVTGN